MFFIDVGFAAGLVGVSRCTCLEESVIGVEYLFGDGHKPVSGDTTSIIRHLLIEGYTEFGSHFCSSSGHNLVVGHPEQVISSNFDVQFPHVWPFSEEFHLVLEYLLFGLEVYEEG